MADLSDRCFWYVVKFLFFFLNTILMRHIYISLIICSQVNQGWFSLAYERQTQQDDDNWRVCLENCLLPFETEKQESNFCNLCKLSYESFANNKNVAMYAFYKNKPEQPCQLTSHLIERSSLLLFPTVYPSEYPPI